MNVINKILKNDLVLIWVVAFVLAIALLLVTLIANRDRDNLKSDTKIANIKKEKDDITDFNYNYEEEDQFSNIQMSADLEDKLKKEADSLSGKISIYKANIADHTTAVQKFVTDTQKTFTYKDSVYYGVWEKDSDRVIYDKTEDSLFFEFKDGVKMNTGVVVSESARQEELQSYFEQFVKKYFGEDIQFTQYKYSSGPEIRFAEEVMTHKMSAVRLIDSTYPLYNSDSVFGDNYLLLDYQGNLIGGRIMLASLQIDKTYNNYFVVAPDELDNYIRNSEYPKVQVIKNYRMLVGDNESIKTSQDYLDYAREGEYKMTIPSKCNVEDGNIGYYYDQSYDIFPIYKLDCTGNTLYQGATYEVKSILFLKAILPK